MQDLVLMACGTLDGAMAFCRANGVSISTVPMPGAEYIVPDGIARNKVILRELQQNGIVIGTLNQEYAGPVTGWRILLAPQLDVVASADLPIPRWHMQLADVSGFIHYHPLAAAFDNVANPLFFQSKVDYLVGNTPEVQIANPALPPAKMLRWNLSDALGSGMQLFYSDLEAPTITSAWRDVEGNVAIYAPLIGVKPTYDSDLLIPHIAVIMQEVLDTEIKLKVVWQHAEPEFSGHFTVAGFDWLGVALDGTPVPGWTNSVYITLPIGVYTLGAVTHYTSGPGGAPLPDSYRTLVIEVY